LTKLPVARREFDQGGEIAGSVDRQRHRWQSNAEKRLDRAFEPYPLIVPALDPALESADEIDRRFIEHRRRTEEFCHAEQADAADFDVMPNRFGRAANETLTIRTLR